MKFYVSEVQNIIIFWCHVCKFYTNTYTDTSAEVGKWFNPAICKIAIWPKAIRQFESDLRLQMQKENKTYNWECQCGQILPSRRKLYAHYKECPEHLQYAKQRLGWTKGLTKDTDERINKISQSLKNYVLSGNSLGRANDPISEENRKQKISNSMKGNTNWQFNKRHGNSKQGWFQGIYCDSSWELAFLVYHKEHGLSIERCKEKRSYIFEGEKHTYIPDFITDEGIIEIKGRFDKKALEKHKQHPDIIVYDKNKMSQCLKYVESKYGVDFWNKLYN